MQQERLNDLKRAGSYLLRSWELKDDLRAVRGAEDANEAERLLAEIARDLSTQTTEGSE